MKGFKEFILRGNVIELAVAVIIGGAFKTIVDKFVEGVVNPALGAIVGTPNFDDAINIGPVQAGLVVTAIVNFLLTAAVIYFFLVKPANKMMAKMKKKEEAAPEPEPAPDPEDVLLLREIRDLLKKG